jgi:hypothetical protein
LDLRFNKKSRKHLSKLMAWGYFSWKGRGTLVEEGGDDEWAEVRYCRILYEKLELFVRQHGKTYFLQEGHPA